ncbi:basic proline-rich protein-like [Choloepus didactylus]|uniref:basic proline-rich protein-like n=1 Tax=Choloepus didactylus TaxID=27675 RepID=UPI0018A00D7C|nr:basic proline-rich protein-like [Choloepus didactylus]
MDSRCRWRVGTQLSPCPGSVCLREPLRPRSPRTRKRPRGKSRVKPARSLQGTAGVRARGGREVTGAPCAPLGPGPPGFLGADRVPRGRTRGGEAAAAGKRGRGRRLPSAGPPEQRAPHGTPAPQRCRDVPLLPGPGGNKKQGFRQTRSCLTSARQRAQPRGRALGAPPAADPAAPAARTGPGGCSISGAAPSPGRPPLQPGCLSSRWAFPRVAVAGAHPRAGPAQATCVPAPCPPHAVPCSFHTRLQPRASRLWPRPSRSPCQASTPGPAQLTCVSALPQAGAPSPTALSLHAPWDPPAGHVLLRFLETASRHLLDPSSLRAGPGEAAASRNLQSALHTKTTPVNSHSLERHGLLAVWTESPEKQVSERTGPEAASSILRAGASGEEPVPQPALRFIPAGRLRLAQPGSHDRPARGVGGAP